MANNNLLVEPETKKWPARSPDLNWLDAYVWGWMVNQMRFEDVTTREELKAAILRVWGRITPALCQTWIRHYWKVRGRGKSRKAQPGPLVKCIEAEGKRFSKPSL